MNRREAKRVACGLVAADISANLGTDAWADQGILDEYGTADQNRIRAAAGDLAAELWRRSDG